MIANISKWFTKQDDKFFSTIKDEQMRQERLEQLNRSRVILAFCFNSTLIVFGLGVIWESNLSATTGLIVVLFGLLLSYLDVTSQIKVIKLYELLSPVDKKAE